MFLGGTITKSMLKLAHSHPILVMYLCYDLLPVQYTELTHRGKPFLTPPKAVQELVPTHVASK